MRVGPLARQRWAFVDTSAYLGLAYQHDSRHEHAVAIAERLVSEHWRLFTTNFIIAETHALVLARAGRGLAARVLNELDQSATRGTTIIRVRFRDELRAREIIARYTDKDFSLTDAISFAIMERLAITQAFTFDQHFAQYGFALLEP